MCILSAVNTSQCVMAVLLLEYYVILYNIVYVSIHVCYYVILYNIVYVSTYT